MTSNLPPNPEELSKWSAIEIMQGGQFDTHNGVVWKFHGINGILVKDWQPHLDTHLGQTFQCVEKLQDTTMWQISIRGDSKDGWQIILNLARTNQVCAENKSIAIAILQALWFAKQGVE